MFLSGGHDYIIIWKLSEIDYLEQYKILPLCGAR